VNPNGDSMPARLTYRLVLRRFETSAVFDGVVNGAVFKVRTPQGETNTISDSSAINEP